MPNDLSAQLEQVYDCASEEAGVLLERYNRLAGILEGFAAQGEVMFCRAPGRVNLIGEHTDYNGYPVLPMALDRDIVLAFKPADGPTIRLVNENPSFEKRSFKAEYPLPPSVQGDWCNYVKAAVHGILEAGLVDRTRVRGFDAVVGGDIPESAGLSSSSAMVVASALAFLSANEAAVDRAALADLLAHAERYVGSEGGGMDQAVSLLAHSGHALRIDFFPLRTQLVPLNKQIAFVVCSSLIRAPKSDTVRYEYNRRVVECRLATALLAHAIGAQSGRTIIAERLADLSPAKTGIASAELSVIASKAIGTQPLSLAGIAERLGTKPGELESKCCKLRDGSVLSEPAEGFQVWKRYRHIITEAARVGSMVDGFRAGDIRKIGELMNQSHSSCRDDYEISCPELDVLVAMGLEHGALGARLTGAGFGGCSVHAVLADRVEEFIGRMKASYYEGYVKREAGRGFAPYIRLHDVIFPCRATRGAGILQSAFGGR